MASFSNNKTLPEKINIMKAKLAGGDILISANDNPGWSPIEDPEFNWGVADYKVDLKEEGPFENVLQSVDYADISQKLYYMERGKNLGNIVDYSVQVLSDSRDKAAASISSNFKNAFSNSSIITKESIKETRAYSLVAQAIQNKYEQKANEETTRDPSLLNGYAGLNDYIKAKYQSNIDSEVSSIISNLDVKVKELTSNSASESSKSIVDEALNRSIITQRSIKEEALYNNTAASPSELKEDAAKSMLQAAHKYEKAVDNTISNAQYNNFSTSIKKQLAEDMPLVSISYDLSHFSLTNEILPPVDWDFTREGEVVTNTGISPTSLNASIETLRADLLRNISEETTAWSRETKELRQYIDDNIASCNNNSKLDAESNLRAEADDVLSGRLDGLEAKVNTVEDNSTTINKALSVRMDKLESQISEIKGITTNLNNILSSLSQRVDDLENPPCNASLPGGMAYRVNALPFSYSGTTGYAYYYICTRSGTIQFSAHDSRNIGGDAYLSFWHNASRLWAGDIDNATHTENKVVTKGDVVAIITTDYSHNSSLSYQGQGYSGGNCTISMKYV